jgi:hypothetical protein
VVLALAIFLASMAALAVLVNAASTRAVLAQQRQDAIFKCQSKLAELASGAVPLGSQGDTPFDEDNSWLWSADVSQNVTGLWTVALTVSRDTSGGGEPVQVTLTRMMLDPSIRGNTADSPLSGGSSSDGSDSSSSSSSGSTGGM